MTTATDLDFMLLSSGKSCRVGESLIGDPGSIHVRTVFLVQISIHQQTAPTVAGLSFLTFFVAGQFTRTVFNYFLI
jgi:hypothetical protein